MEGENERGRDDRRDVVKLATLSEQFALGFKGNVISVADSGKSPLLSIILPAGGLWLSPSLFPLSAVANSLMTNCSSFSWSWTKWHSDSRRKSQSPACARMKENSHEWCPGLCLVISDYIMSTISKQWVTFPVDKWCDFILWDYSFWTIIPKSGRYQVDLQTVVFVCFYFVLFQDIIVFHFSSKVRPWNFTVPAHLILVSPYRQLGQTPVPQWPWTVSALKKMDGMELKSS